MPGYFSDSSADLFVQWTEIFIGSSTVDYVFANVLDYLYLDRQSMYYFILQSVQRKFVQFDRAEVYTVDRKCFRVKHCCLCVFV